MMFSVLIAATVGFVSQLQLSFKPLCLYNQPFLVTFHNRIVERCLNYTLLTMKNTINEVGHHLYIVVNSTKVILTFR